MTQLQVMGILGLVSLCLFWSAAGFKRMRLLRMVNGLVMGDLASLVALILSAYLLSSLTAMILAFCNVQSEVAKYAYFFGYALLGTFIIVMPFSLEPVHAKKIFTWRGVLIAAAWISTISLTHVILMLKAA